MAYTDKAYFLANIDEADLDKLTGGIDANLTEKIKAADSLIDGYLASALVSVPMSSPPDMIRQLSYDIATYFLHDRIDFNDVPERVEKKYQAAMKTLENIAKKLIIIPGIPAENKDQSIKYDGGDNIIDVNSF